MSCCCHHHCHCECCEPSGGVTIDVLALIDFVRDMRKLRRAKRLRNAWDAEKEGRPAEVRGAAKIGETSPDSEKARRRAELVGSSDD